METEIDTAKVNTLVNIVEFDSWITSYKIPELDSCIMWASDNLWILRIKLYN
jgi:hypothetical protein